MTVPMPEELHRHKRIYQSLTPSRRMQLLHQLSVMTESPHKRWLNAPLVKTTHALLILVTILALALINVKGVTETIFMIWGSYVISLDLFILYRTAKKLALRRI